MYCIYITGNGYYNSDGKFSQNVVSIDATDYKTAREVADCLANKYEKNVYLTEMLFGPSEYFNPESSHTMKWNDLNIGDKFRYKITEFYHYIKIGKDTMLCIKCPKDHEEDNLHTIGYNDIGNFEVVKLN